MISLTCHHSYCAGCIANAVLASTRHLCDNDRIAVTSYINNIYGDTTSPASSPNHFSNTVTGQGVPVPNVAAQCPLCRTGLTPLDLHPNLALAALTNELNVYCGNRSKGVFCIEEELPFYIIICCVLTYLILNA